jgi:N-formylglutamate deformylase
MTASIDMTKTPSGAFFTTAPQNVLAPVVFDSPHSGLEYPPDFRPSASRAEIQTTWDAYVDELCAHVPAAGATLVAARFPRAYIDANRAANDIDPEILDTPWPEAIALSEHGVRGMGLIRRFALPGVPMYDRRLTVAEVSSRIHDFYHPYRRALQTVIDDVWRRHGVVWHFDCHSMKSRGRAMHRDQGAQRPDFVIGDRNGTTAPATVTAWVAEFFARRGYQVKINEPYRGADIVRAHGNPERRCYSIQIEINRSLYMDESTFERRSGFAQVREEISDLARAVAAGGCREPDGKVGR